MAERAPADAVRRARFAATVAVFGAVWGAIEMSVGAALHAAHLPFAGLVLTFLGLGVGLVARRVLPLRGVVLAAGLVAATLKLLSFAAAPWSAAVAILAEAAVAEAVLLVLGTTRIGFAAAGGLAGLVPIPHFVLGQALLFGAGVWERYAKLVAWGADLLGLSPDAAGTVIAALVALHAVVGLAAGLGAWALAGAALRRMGRAAP